MRRGEDWRWHMAQRLSHLPAADHPWVQRHGALHCWRLQHAHAHIAPNGLYRVDTQELGSMGLGRPVRLVVPANTLIVADTFGFHQRAQARWPTIRVELWAGSRRHLGAPAGARSHLVQRLGGHFHRHANRTDPWHARGPQSPGMLPHWRPQDLACGDARHGAY